MVTVENAVKEQEDHRNIAKMMNEDETAPKQSFETIRDGRKHKNLKHHKNLTQSPQLVWSFSILVSIGSSLSRWWIYECLGKVIRSDTECLGVPCVVHSLHPPIHTNPHQSTPIHTCTQSAPPNFCFFCHLHLCYPSHHLILSGQHSFDESQPFWHDDPQWTGRHWQAQLKVSSNSGPAVL